MKRIRFFALILALLLLFALVGCGSGEETAESSTEPSSEEEEYVQTVFRSDSDQTLYADAACSFRLIRTGRNEQGEYYWAVELKNFTSAELLMSLDDVYVNDYAADPCWALTLAAGESLQTEVTWFAGDFAACGISDVGKINVRFRAYPKGKPQSMLADEELTVYPKGIEAYTAQGRTWLSTDEVLVESELCAMAVTAVEADSVHGDVEDFTLTFYLENRSDNEAYFSLENVKLNGQNSDPAWQRVLGAGKKTFSNVIWSDSELAELEIAQVLSIQFDLVLRDGNGTELARESLTYKP